MTLPQHATADALPTTCCAPWWPPRRERMLGSSPQPGASCGSRCSTCPSLAPTSEPPSLGGGSPLAELVQLDRGEEAIALVPLDSPDPIALGTAFGVVKRVTPGDVPAKDAWDVISLKEGDRVIGAAPAPDGAELVFIAEDASLLHFEATQSSARPQGRAGGGIAGIKLSPGVKALFFGVVTAPDAVVATIAGPADALPGTTPGAAKWTRVQRIPGKGPRHGRRARPALPQGRRHVAARVGGPGPGSRDLGRWPGS